MFKQILEKLGVVTTKIREVCKKINLWISIRRKSCSGILAVSIALGSLYNIIIGVEIDNVVEIYKNVVQEAKVDTRIFRQDAYRGLIELLKEKPVTKERDGLIEVFSRKAKSINTTANLECYELLGKSQIAAGVFKMGNGLIQFAPIVTAVSIAVEKNSPIYIGATAATLGSVMIIKANYDSKKLFDKYIYGRY